MYSALLGLALVHRLPQLVVVAACLRSEPLAAVCAWLCAARPHLSIPALGLAFGLGPNGALPVRAWTVGDLARLLDAYCSAFEFASLKNAFIVLAPGSPLVGMVQCAEDFASCARDNARKHLVAFMHVLEGLIASEGDPATREAAAADPLRDPGRVRRLADVIADRVLASCSTDFERRNLLAILGQTKCVCCVCGVFF